MQQAQISLDDRQHALISRLVRSGRYASTTEVVAEALALLEEREARDEMLDEIERQIEAGLTSGDAEPMESAEDLVASFRQRR